jgi:hypothetical protein
MKYHITLYEWDRLPETDKIRLELAKEQGKIKVTPTGIDECLIEILDEFPQGHVLARGRRIG